MANAYSSYLITLPEKVKNVCRLFLILILQMIEVMELKPKSVISVFVKDSVDKNFDE